MKYWLIKSEPEDYSIEDLEKEQQSAWTGIRNYQARNIMTTEMSVGDWLIFYHSNAKPPHVAGLAKVASKAKPDSTQFDQESKYFEKRATHEKPVWACVDVKFVEKFATPLPLSDIKATKALKDLMLLKRGMRLSIQPISKKNFGVICKMAGSQKFKF